MFVIGFDDPTGAADADGAKATTDIAAIPTANNELFRLCILILPLSGLTPGKWTRRGLAIRMLSMANLTSFALDGRVKTSFGDNMRPITLALLMAGIFTSANVFITWSNPVPWWAHLLTFLLFTALMLGSVKTAAKEVSPSVYELPYDKRLITFSIIMAVIAIIGIVIYTLS